MTNWRKRVLVGEAFELFDTEGFEASRDAVIAILERELPEAPPPILGRLKRAKTERGFNSAWDTLYDWADVNLVWLQTW